LQSTAIEPLKYWGETLGFWVQTGALIISAIAAVWLIWANYRGDRRRHTVEIAKELVRDREITETKKVMAVLHAQKKGNFARYLDQKDSPEYLAIMKTLNNYEFLATGIRAGAFDEKIIKRMQYSIAVRDWESLCPFINELRAQTRIDTLFQEFEWMGKRWKKKPLRNSWFF
jgi:Domain of unknown function (DUF4760)